MRQLPGQRSHLQIGMSLKIALNRMPQPLLLQSLSVCSLFNRKDEPIELRDELLGIQVDCKGGLELVDQCLFWERGES